MWNIQALKIIDMKSIFYCLFFLVGLQAAAQDAPGVMQVNPSNFQFPRGVYELGFRVPRVCGTPAGTPKLLDLSYSKSKGAVVYDTCNRKLKVWNGTTWDSIAVNSSGSIEYVIGGTGILVDSAGRAYTVRADTAGVLMSKTRATNTYQPLLSAGNGIKIDGSAIRWADTLGNTNLRFLGGSIFGIYKEDAIFGNTSFTINEYGNNIEYIGGSGTGRLVIGDNRAELSGVSGAKSSNVKTTKDAAFINGDSIKLAYDGGAIYSPSTNSKTKYKAVLMDSITGALVTISPDSLGGSSGITALTGDVTASGSGIVAATLATVNSNVGTFGNSTTVPTYTVNGKGLITASSQTAIPTASTSTTGLLTSTDWNTFNGKGSGTVTSVATGLGLTGGTITTSGTVSLDTANATVISRQRTAAQYAALNTHNFFTTRNSLTSLTLNKDSVPITTSNIFALTIDTAGGTAARVQRTDLTSRFWGLSGNTVTSPSNYLGSLNAISTRLGYNNTDYLLLNNIGIVANESIIIGASSTGGTAAAKTLRLNSTGGTTNGIDVRVPSGNVFGAFNLYTNGSVTGQLIAGSTTYSSGALGANSVGLLNQSSAGELIIGTIGTGKIVFLTNGAATTNRRMTIDNTGSVGIGNYSPAASSILDLTSTTQGLLTPRMTTSQRNAISSPAEGLIVYDTDLKATMIYTATIWGRLGQPYSVPIKLARDFGISAYGGSISNPTTPTSATALGNQTMQCTAVLMEGDTIITGLRYYLGTAGVFTANNTNSISLYSMSSGTATKIAETANSSALWTTTANAWATAPFASTVALTRGLYYGCMLYCQSAQTTAPTVGGITLVNAGGSLISTFRESFQLASQTTAPSSITISGAATNAQIRSLVLY
jgi:hypothetical protein